MRSRSRRPERRRCWAATRRNRPARPAVRPASIASSTSLRTAGSMLSGKYSLGTPTLQASEVAVQAGGEVGHVQWRRGGVARVGAADGGEDSGGVPHAACEGPDLVEGAGERDEAVAADASVRRLDADDPVRAPPAGGSTRRYPSPGRRCTRPAAVAAAEPPEQPPGTRPRSQGLWVGKNAEFSVEEPIANSSMFDLPTMTAPAAFKRSITAASYGGTKFSSMREPHVVRTPRVIRTSLMQAGIPVRGAASPRARRSIGRPRLIQGPVLRDGNVRLNAVIHG